MTQKALIYCRVSSKKQSTEGSGLTSQHQRCDAYASQQGYEVEKVFPDDITGGGNFMKRQGMVAMLNYIKAHPETSYVIIFDDLKRLARDTKYYLILRETLDALKVRVECLNFTFDDTPEGEFYETVIAAGGQLERKQGARQVRQKIIARFEAGYWGTNAPLGYKMQTAKGKSRLLVRDEPMASYIQEALEGFACGRFETQVEVGRFLNNCPEFKLIHGKSMHADTIKSMLTKSVYAGMVELKKWGIEARKGHHEALIDMQTFQKNQIRLGGRAKAPIRKDMALSFPLRGAVCCAGCNKPYTSTLSKGRNKYYPYYLCLQKECEFYGKSLKRDDVEGAFEKLVMQLSPSKVIVKSFGHMFRHQWNEMGRNLKDSRKSFETQLGQLQTQKSRTIDKLINTNHSSVTAACEQRIQEIELDIVVTEEKIQNFGRPLADFDENFRTAIEFLADPYKLWASDNYEHKRAVLRMGFSEPLVYDRNEGFRTACKSSPFRLLDGFQLCNKEMVDDTGLEPVTRYGL